MLREPLPACVWLSTDPAMSGDFSTRQGLRLSVVIPSTDRRLVRWSKFCRKHGVEVVEVVAEVFADERFRRAAAHFWLYFGTITPERIRAIDQGGFREAA
jgi:hypothetical protein